MFSDLKIAIRSLRRSPGFTVVAVLTLALGIGAVTAVFSLLSQLLLHPVPYPNAERLVVPFSVNQGRGIDISRIGVADYLAWKREQVFEHLAIIDTYGRSYDLTDELGEPEQARVVGVSSEYFVTLGIAKPLLGRTFRPEEHQLPFNAVRPCILSYGLWTRRYRSDPHIVGQTIQLDGNRRSVVGVMSQDALWPTDIDVMEPLFDVPPGAPVPAKPPTGDFMIFAGIARLKADRSLDETNALLATIAKRTELAYPRERKGWSNHVVPLHEVILGRQARTSLLMSMAAVCCLLAIAVINVAGLLLSRAIARRQEMQVRAALGAGRWRLTRYLLAESAVLALPGVALGLLLAVWTLHVLSTLSSSGALPLPHVHVDSGMFAFALSVSMMTTVICGLAPLSHTLRRELNPAHRHGSTAGSRMLNGLIVAEITLSVLLLVGAGLLIRSFMAIQRIDPGFQSERLLTFAVNVPFPKQTDSAQSAPNDPQLIVSAYHDIIGRLQSAPGVLSVTMSSALPVGGGGEYFSAFFRTEDSPEAPSGAAYPAFIGGAVLAENSWYGASPTATDHPAMVNVVGAGYFNTLGIRLIAGRDFDSRDTADGNPVIVINETLARRAFPDENPLGKRIRWGLQGYREIVGVVGDVRFLGREDEVRALTYIPQTQWAHHAMMLTVRTAGEPSAVLSLVRSHLQKIHPGLVVSDARTMTDILERSVAPRRSAMTLVAVLAGAALLLAAIGLYGALSYTVAQRVKEIGIRMALGARPGSLLAMVVGEGLWLMLIGVAFGSAAALLLTRLMAHLLYEVSPTDPITFISIGLLLTGVALAACYLPARRATKVDPLVALRAE